MRILSVQEREASRHTVERMARAALADSGIGADDVDLIKLQAAGSPHNDAEEIAGLKAYGNWS